MIDEYQDRLHRAGWSLGDCRQGDAWVVTGANGENVIRASASTQAEAWRIALEQGQAVGMVADATR